MSASRTSTLTEYSSPSRLRRFAWLLCASLGSACGGEKATPQADIETSCVPEAELLPIAKPPRLLSQTGLFDETGALASYVESFEPRYKLWSDGADKRRYAYIPKCKKIDVADLDHWVFPVGSRFWKEFTRDGVRVETRLIHRFGEGPEDWFYTAYLWNDTNSDAQIVPDGVPNAKGTTHDVPSQKDCKLCHEPQPERILGFGALQLTHDGPGLTLRKLSDGRRLSVAHSEGFEVPGSPLAKEALGYLHANCGACHNRFFQTVNLRLRLHVTDKRVEDTDTYTTTLGQEPVSFMCPGCQLVHAGHASDSVVVHRLQSREMGLAMPPIASKVVDEVGMKAVVDWINSL
ncbi:MAG: hypothetical protein SFV15_09770 [Polyangiaceae bacterium]|nr:hypothetical protein [Polyangiaceae bacterium]